MVQLLSGTSYFQEIDRLEKELEELERDMPPELEPIVYPSRSDFVIAGGDFNRSASKERTYLKKYKSFILRVFGNSCAICHSSGLLDIDHMWIPKSLGGCFKLLKNGGGYVNNAIPLCETCNRKKGDKDYRTFIENTRLQEILSLNNFITSEMNKYEANYASDD